MDALLVLYGIVNVGLGIAILLYFFANLKEEETFIKYGVVLLIITIAFDILGGNSMLSAKPVEIIMYIKVIIYTALGMYLCKVTGCRDLPLFRKLFRESKDDDINYKRYILSTIAVIAASVAFSYLLFKLTSPSESEYIKNLTQSNDALLKAKVSRLSMALTMPLIAITEELTFRLVFQNLIAMQLKLDENKYWIAIIISSALWTLGHTHALNPEWVKYAQIFPIGLALGKLQKKYGVECCIIVHTFFNIILMLMAQGLIKV